MLKYYFKRLNLFAYNLTKTITVFVMTAQGSKPSLYLYFKPEIFLYVSICAIDLVAFVTIICGVH